MMKDVLARAALLVALVLAVVACDEKTDAGGPPTPVDVPAADAGPAVADAGANPAADSAVDPGVLDAAAPPEADARVEPPPEGCTENTFAPVTEYGNMENTGRRYTATDGNEYPFTAMVVELRSGEDGPSEAGTYDVRIESSLKDCSVCVYALTGCNPETGQCEKVFVPDAGTIEVRRLGRAGRHMVAALHHVAFVEVELDRSDLSVTRVEGGSHWCADEQPIDVELKPPPANIGEEVANFSLQNCETGEFVDLDTLAGHTMSTS